MIAIATIGPESADYDALSRLHGAAFAESWSGQSIHGLLGTPGTFAVTATARGDLLGFAMARIAADEAEILTLAVLEAARRQGVGAALVEAAGRHAFDKAVRSMFLEVATANRAARALYTKLGFLEVGRRQGYYRVAPGESADDALLLRAGLPLGKTA